MGHSSRLNQPVCAEDGTSRCPELPLGTPLSLLLPPQAGEIILLEQAKQAGWQAAHSLPLLQSMLQWGWDPQGMKPCLKLVKQCVKALL